MLGLNADVRVASRNPLIPRVKFRVHTGAIRSVTEKAARYFILTSRRIASRCIDATLDIASRRTMTFIDFTSAVHYAELFRPNCVNNPCDARAIRKIITTWLRATIIRRNDWKMCALEVVVSPCLRDTVAQRNARRGIVARAEGLRGRDYGGAMDRTTGLSGKPASPMRNAANTVAQIARGLSFTDGGGDTLSLRNYRYAPVVAPHRRESDFPKLRRAQRCQRAVHDKAEAASARLTPDT